jgi:putative glutamine amidotransferase
VIHSHHHQGIGEVGAGLEVTATAPDATVEGLEDPAKRFAVGVLWHPEEAHTDAGAPIFRALIEAAAEYAARRS